MPIETYTHRKGHADVIKWPNTRHKGSRMMKLEKAVRKLTGDKEEKHIDTYLSGFATSIAGTITPITLIAEGLTPETRVGQKIHCTGIEWKLEWDMNSQAAITNSAFGVNRFMIIRDKQCLGSAIAGNNILDYSVQTDPTCPRQIDIQDEGRFFILKDQFFSLVNVGSLTATQAVVDMSSGVKLLHGKIKCNFPIHYGTANGNIAACLTNTVFVMTSSDAVSNASISGYFRVFYTDD